MSRTFSIVIGLLASYLATLTMALDLDQVFADTAHGIANGSITVTITPGAGLPSLQSLGLTEYDLFAAGPPHQTRQRYERSSGLDKRYTCLPAGLDTQTGVPEFTAVLVCWAYLFQLLTTPCAINIDPWNTEFCAASSSVAGLSFVTTIWGEPACDAPTSSFCEDVATALEDVINDCEVCGQYIDGYGPICTAAGEEYAFGNGCLLVLTGGEVFFP